MRNVNSPLRRFYVMSPEGRIKSLRYAENVQPPQLTVKRGKVKATGEPVVVAMLDPSYFDKGWRDLEKLYEAEGRGDVYEKVFLAREHAIARGQRVADLEDKHFPKAVLEARAGHQFKEAWTPPEDVGVEWAWGEWHENMSLKELALECVMREIKIPKDPEPADLVALLRSSDEGRETQKTARAKERAAANKA